MDEFQDINHLQYDIVKMLAAPENNLFVVGDDDQSIYHFRGAHPEIMLNFPEDLKCGDGDPEYQLPVQWKYLGYSHEGDRS